MTGTNCDLYTHKSSRSYLNHLVQDKAEYENKGHQTKSQGNTEHRTAATEDNKDITVPEKADKRTNTKLGSMHCPHSCTDTTDTFSLLTIIIDLVADYTCSIRVQQQRSYLKQFSIPK